jgi:hypothetical protein
MTVNTKYDIKQEVYYLKFSHETHKVYCDLCDNTGELTIAGTDKKAKCPECNGYGYQWSEKVQQWSIEGCSAVGQVRFVQTLLNYPIIQYMLEKTGVGSGKIHDEFGLFKTKEEAQASCDHMNKNKLFDRDNRYLR